MREIIKTSRFSRDIKKLKKAIQIDAFEKAQILAENIFENTLHIKKLVGYSDKYRVVIIDNHRMIFSFDDKNLYLLRILHRKDIYKNLP